MYISMNIFALGNVPKLLPIFITLLLLSKFNVKHPLKKAQLKKKRKKLNYIEPPYTPLYHMPPALLLDIYVIMFFIVKNCAAKNMLVHKSLHF